MSLRKICLSSGCGILTVSYFSPFHFHTQYRRFLFCAETSELFIIIGSTHRIRVISSLSAFRILATFSSRKYVGFVSFRSRTYSKNSDDFSPARPFPSFFAIDRSWQGEPPIIKSIGQNSTTSLFENKAGQWNSSVSQYPTSVTLPIWIISG